MFGFTFNRNRNKVKTFLRSEDLDDTLKSFRDLGELNKRERALIDKVIKKWSDKQAISNILFYPSILRKEEQLNTLLKGLHSEKTPYYALAATVGLQDIDKSNLSEESRVSVVNALLSTAKKYAKISDRVVVTLENFLKIDDASSLCDLLYLQNNTTQHNIIAWLLKNYSNKDDLASLIKDCNLSQELQNIILEKYDENESKRANGEFLNLQYSLLSYLPNLRDMRNPK